MRRQAVFTLLSVELNMWSLQASYSGTVCYSDSESGSQSSDHQHLFRHGIKIIGRLGRSLI